jgi:hypothetical protein
MLTKFRSPSKRPRFSIVTDPTLQSQSNDQNLVWIAKNKNKNLDDKKSQ